MTSSQRTTLNLVAFIVFVDMAGVGMITPVTPQLIEDIAHVGVGRAAEIGGYMLVVFATMQFLFSPIIGGLSDKFGRRPALLITLASFAIDYAVMAFAPTLTLLALGRMVSGIMGATWAAANSCVADVVPENERGGAFGLIGGAGAAGLVFGPAIGGIAGEYGVRLPFLIAALLAAVGVLVGFFKFAETLPLHARRDFDMRRANPIGSLIHISKTPFLLGCLAVLFIIQLALQAQIAIWPYYGIVAFSWTPLTVGLTTSFYGVLMVVVRAVLTKRAVNRWGAETTARHAILFSIPSYLLLAFAPNTGVVVVAIMIGAIAGMAFPAIQAMMSAQAPSDAQGELQGAIASSSAMTAMIGPIVMTQIFEHFVNRAGPNLPGAPFLVSALLLCVASVVLWRLTSRRGAEANA